MAISHGGGNMCLVCRGRGERRREWVGGREESGMGGKGEEDEWVGGEVGWSMEGVGRRGSGCE